MGRLVGRLLAGAAAGAAGTAALDAVTYLDMAVRGRPPSSTPERSVEVSAHRVGLEIPGDEQSRANRLSGLGALSGIATGVCVGVLGSLALGGRDLPLPVTAAALGTGAMLLSNASMMRLGVTDPRAWTSGQWIEDAVPHAAYGVTAAAVLRLPGPAA